MWVFIDLDKLQRDFGDDFYDQIFRRNEASIIHVGRLLFAVIRWAVRNIL